MHALKDHVGTLTVDYGSTQIPQAYQCEHILYFYIKKLVAWRVKQHDTWPTNQSGTFTNCWNWHWKYPTKHLWPPNHRPPLTSPFSFSYSSAATIFHFFDKLKLTSSKVHFILSGSMPIQPRNERWRLYLRQLQQLVELWAADQSLKVTEITPGCSSEKQKKSLTACSQMRHVLIFCGRICVLAFDSCGQ